ncbi:hypothetical protein WJX72_005420 [[Myrmecia] bisecta]|uniref:PhoD-like phosphatase domain-containing protein n=1 Tax=[Myrmecia] bisecta TaxID=41462 RepID=A0AAW1QBG2_9CHLO
MDLHNAPLADGAKLSPQDWEAIETASPEARDAAELASTVVAGPYLQLLSYEPTTFQWRGSVLVLLAVQGMPLMSLQATSSPNASQVPGRVLDTLENWTCWRFDLAVAATQQEQRWEYTLTLPPSFDNKLQADQKYSFVVPAQKQQWHWGFHSCNGLSSGVDPKMFGPELWADVLAVHKAKPLHLMVGGGDQIYNDGLWKVPSLRAWLSLPTGEAKYQAPFSPQMGEEVSHWLLQHYILHFSVRIFRDALACIPQVGIWDDHDIFDGWGSYPEKLQNCPVFQGVYDVSRRMYLMFQHHTTLALYRENGCFGPPNVFSLQRNLGAGVVLLMPDSRAERTKAQIMSPAAYQELFQRILNFPNSVKHLVIVTTVPLLYPKLPLAEGVLATIDAVPLLKKGMQKTGVGASILDKFGNADLLDDIVDHWDAKTHIDERNMFIQKLQGLSKEKEIRVTFISGDVHVGGIGRFYTHPKVRHLRNDYRFMTQVISSAIMNTPPPAAVTQLLQRTNRASLISPGTKEKMVKTFQADFPNSNKLLERRNWCEVSYMPPPPGNLTSSFNPFAKDDWGSLVFSLRAEDPKAKEQPPKAYDTIVPSYIKHAAGMRPAAMSLSRGGPRRWFRACLCRGNAPPSSTNQIKDF